MLLFPATADLPGAGISVASIVRLITTAEAIVVAGIIQGTAIDSTVSVTLSVEEALRGTARAGDTINLVWNAPAFGSERGEVQKGRGLFLAPAWWPVDRIIRRLEIGPTESVAGDVGKQVHLLGRLIPLLKAR